jgi:hypothetical protein
MMDSDNNPLTLDNTGPLLRSSSSGDAWLLLSLAHRRSVLNDVSHSIGLPARADF